MHKYSLRSSAFVFVLVCMIFTLGFEIAAEAVEQRAYPLADPLTLYKEPKESSQSWSVSLPENGVKVPSAIRDKSDALWYKVTINGRTGWLHNEGIRLLMGGKSKVAANVYKRCAQVRQKVMKNTPRAWSESSSIAYADGTIITYKRDGGMFQVFKSGKNVQDIYFMADGGNALSEFLGYNPINMHRNDLRKKVGTPTMRETPDGERDVSILSYELPDRDMTMAFHMRNDRVEWFELYQGATGCADGDWDAIVLNEREN